MRPQAAGRRQSPMNVKHPEQREGSGPSEAEIVQRIHDAVMEQQLPPGTKLSEAALCEAFGVTRGRIRRALLLLASRKIVELHPNRGAFVARPTTQEAHDIFEARRAVEDALVGLAAERATQEDIVRLEAHLEAEIRAHGSSSRRRAIRLSGEFHVLLAELALNEVLHEIVRQLVARTSLIIAFHGSSTEQSCGADEHRELLSALRERDGDGARMLMREHLLHIERDIEVSRTRGAEPNLVQLFKSHQG